MVAEPLVIFLPAILLGAYLLYASGTSVTNWYRRIARDVTARDAPPEVAYGMAYVAAFIGTVLIAGGNYYSNPGRMGASAMVILVVVTALSIPVAQPAPKPRTRHKAAFAVILLMPWLGIVAHDTEGVYHGRIARESARAHNTSTSSWREFGYAVDNVRQQLGRPTISALMVNVGAASLCCRRIEVLDLGLLANADLARDGWDAFPGYLRHHRPDIVNVYGVWAQVSGVYDDPWFRREYTPVVLSGFWTFLRNDHHARLRGLCVGVPMADEYLWPTWPGSAEPGTAELHAVDRDYLASRGADRFCSLS